MASARDKTNHDKFDRPVAALVTGGFALVLLGVAAWPRFAEELADTAGCIHSMTLHLAEPESGALKHRRSPMTVFCAEQGDPIPGAAALLFSRRLDINQVSMQDLRAVPGLPDALAAEIISRRKHILYNNIDELLELPGCGRKTLRRLKVYLRCSRGAAVGADRFDSKPSD